MYYKPNQSPKNQAVFWFLIADERQRVHGFNERARPTSWCSQKRSSSEFSSHSGPLVSTVCGNRKSECVGVNGKHNCKESSPSCVYKGQRIVLNQASETGKRWETTARHFPKLPGVREEQGSNLSDPFTRLAKGNNGRGTGLVLWVSGKSRNARLKPFIQHGSMEW